MGIKQEQGGEITDITGMITDKTSVYLGIGIYVLYNFS